MDYDYDLLKAAIEQDVEGLEYNQIDGGELLVHIVGYAMSMHRIRKKQSEDREKDIAYTLLGEIVFVIDLIKLVGLEEKEAETVVTVVSTMISSINELYEGIAYLTLYRTDEGELRVHASKTKNDAAVPGAKI